ncbi:hypothetical protein J2Z79_003562 [Symbiobacterium terraclitae]|uniref:Uncharacterized protein n=1 Tax=Symbiobacterium terraclitae TaxID=557451 RepID=A0ABS4JX50_9FIRM|nr:hypothetical protein [Symbiobacterium terraclitae]MBP2020108.1 hypothetical protein [Symbiobacterium terraclitae]
MPWIGTLHLQILQSILRGWSDVVIRHFRLGTNADRSGGAGQGRTEKIE